MVLIIIREVISVNSGFSVCWMAGNTASRLRGRLVDGRVGCGCQCAGWCYCSFQSENAFEWKRHDHHLSQRGWDEPDRYLEYKNMGVPPTPSQFRDSIRQQRSYLRDYAEKPSAGCSAVLQIAGWMAANGGLTIWRCRKSDGPIIPVLKTEVHK